MKLKAPETHRRLSRRHGPSAARAHGDPVWRVVGFQPVYGSTPLVRLETGRGENKMQAVVPLTEVVSLDVPRPPAHSVLYAQKDPDKVACWGIKHPYMGSVFAVKLPAHLPPFRPFIEQFKRLIKPEDRKWNWKAKLWYVNQQRRVLLEALLRQHFKQDTTCVETETGDAEFDICP